MIFRPELVEKILAGEKTETRRKVKPGAPCRYQVGKTYAVQPGRGKPGVARVRILEVEREPLGWISELSAFREGFKGRADFFRYWTKLYGSTPMKQEVWAIRFELVKPEKRSGGASIIALGPGAL